MFQNIDKRTQILLIGLLSMGLVSAGVFGFSYFFPRNQTAVSVDLSPILQTPTIISSSSQTQSSLQIVQINQITTSIFPVYLIVKEIAKGGIPIKNIASAKTGFSEYFFGSDDYNIIKSSKGLIFNGAGADNWAKETSKTLQNNDLSFLNLSQNTPKNTPTKPFEISQNSQTTKVAGVDAENSLYGAAGELDFNFWQDWDRTKLNAEQIAQFLVNLDPENTSLYQQNLATFTSQIDGLKQEFNTGLAACKYPKKAIITSGAFEYLAKNHNLELYPITGLETDKIIPAQIETLQKYALEKNIKVLLINKNLFSATEKTLLEKEIKGLFIWNLRDGQTGLETETYPEITRQNLGNLKKAFGCV